MCRPLDRCCSHSSALLRIPGPGPSAATYLAPTSGPIRCRGRPIAGRASLDAEGLVAYRHRPDAGSTAIVSRMPDLDAWLFKPEWQLAHYTRAETAFAHILPERRLRMSPYRAMRDPLENKRPVIGQMTSASDEQEAQQRLFAAVQKEIGRVRDPYLLLSFTEAEPPEPDEAES